MAEGIGFAILGRIGENLVDPIGRQLRYLFCFNNNIQNLQTELEDLKTARDAVQLEVDQARNNVRIVEPQVEAWLIKVNRNTTEVEAIIESKAQVQKGCLKGLCLCHYSLSKKAVKKSQDLVRLQYDRVKLVDSRTLVINEIVKALKDDGINLIGICGMGGIGKTTLAKIVAKWAKEENLFNEVAMAVVRQEPNLIKVQGCIADMLGLKLDDRESPIARASLLRKRLLQKKSLVILDDIWAEFDLEDLGFPLGGNANKGGCKILFTSRFRNMWRGIQNKRYIELKALLNEEQWHLFREKAGDCADAPNLLPLAKEIVYKCEGLPLALVTMGSALVNERNQHHWKDALRQLSTPSSESILLGVSAQVYQALDFSYNFLKDEGAKKLFLLCCLFPEDSSIPIENLVRFVIGLQWFEGIDKVDEVRDRVYVLVNQLKSSYLLADGDEEEEVKMDDVVRNVAISIASREKHGFLIIHGEKSREWPKNATYEPYTSISVISNEIAEFPDGLRFPKLVLLLIGCRNSSLKIPSNFFEGMGELKVLELGIPLNISLLPSSLQILSNLQTLCLDYSHQFDDMSVIGELLNLEILSFRHSRIRELPKEIGRLANLRLLDLTGSTNLKRISPGVISRLVRLEELYLRGSKFSNWEKEGEEEGRNASLREFESLSNLNILEIIIKDAALLTRIPLFSQLKKYTIILDNDDYCWPTRFQKNDTSIPSESGYLKNTELVRIEGGGGSKEVVHELVREGVEGLQHVKVLSINECDTLECLANTMDRVKPPNTADPIVFRILKSLYLSALPNLREICRSQLPVGSFGKLSFMCLENLPSLTSFCRGIDEIEFPQLKELRLKNLPKLNCLFPNYKKSNMSSDSNKNCNAAFLSLFPQKAAFPSLEVLELSCLDNLEGLGYDPLSVQYFSKLIKVRIRHFEELLNVIPSQLFAGLQNLEELTVEDCTSLEKVFKLEGVDFEERDSKMLPSLKSLKLKNLPKLNHLPKGDSIGFMYIPQLSILHVHDLDSLKYIFSPAMIKSIPQLQELDIMRCKLMSRIVAEENGQGGSSVDKIEFPQLKILRLYDMPNLVSFFPKVIDVVAASNDSLQSPMQPISKQKIAFPSLEVLELKHLDKLEGLGHDTIGIMCIPLLSSLHVHDCDRLRYLFSTAIMKGILQLQELEIMRCKLMSRIVAEENGQGESSVDKIEFPQLKILRLCDMPNLVSFFPKVIDVVAASNDSLQSPMHISKQKIAFPSLEVLELKHLDKLEGLGHDTIGIMCIPRLSSLHVHDCDRLRYLFSPAMMKGILHLKEMKIMRCKMMSRIFAEKNEQGEISVDRFEFPQLKILQFYDLPNLVSFFPEEVSTMATSSPAHHLFNQKIAFPSLEVLELKHLHKLEGLFIGIMYIPRLSILHVHDCDRLRYLFSPAMVRSILQLQESEIMRCKTMSRIVADEKGQGDKFEFPQLKILQLYDLPNLVSFFPEEVSTEATSSSAHPLFNQKIAFPSLEVLELKHVHKLEVLDIGIMYVPQLHILHVHDCDSLKYLFSTVMVKTIPQLQELEIMRCKIMTRIVAEENGHGETLVEKIEFPQLKILLLYYLPNLMGFFPKVVSTVAASNESLQSPVLPLFNEGENVTFPSMEKLHVSYCGSFQNLFSPFMAKYLVHLQELIISKCSMVEEVVSNEDGKMDGILFPKLKYLELRDLPVLKSFFHVNDEWEFPLLESITVFDCPKTKTLSPGFLCSPKLQIVWVKWWAPDGGVEGFRTNDLNYTLQQVYSKLQEQLQRREQQQQQQEQLHQERGRAQSPGAAAVGLTRLSHPTSTPSASTSLPSTVVRSTRTRFCCGC